MNFIKSSYLSAIATTISIITRVIVNKITAVLIGPEGFAIYGQFKDFVNITTSLSQLGTNNGIIKYAAETKENVDAFIIFINTAIKIHFVSALVTSFGVFFFKDWISNSLFETTYYSKYLIIIGFSLVFSSLHNLLLGVLNGLKLLKKYIYISIFATITTALSTIILVNYFHLTGLIFSLAVNHLIVFIISIIFLLKNKFLNVNILTFKLERTYLGKLLHFSLMNLSGAISLSLSLLFIRTNIIKNLGIDSAGLWDSLWRISTLYLLFLTSSFKFYILPTFSALKNSQIKNEVMQIWKITFPIIIIITCGIYIFKDFLIRFLFTSEFLLIKSIMLFQLLGDVFRIHSWTLGNILIAKSKTREFITLQIIWALIFSSLSTLLILSFGLKGITMAYLATNIVHFLFLNISLKNILWKH